ncbi:MAG: sigma-70 family RNA polymerase sigma factor [Ruminococcus sp.]|nr:sigma-70 family RNA polymerase sigma factor [Ruminococcus sp.]
MTDNEYREQIAQMSKTMFRYCLSRTSSYHDAEDLAQEILLISCKNGNCFPNEKAFYAFVWRTAENILRSWYRDNEKRGTAELDEKISDGSWEELEEQAKENEQLSLIARELSLLNSNYRRAMVAYYIDGLSVRDISESFGLSQSMVKYLLFQSRKRIKEGINMERNFGKLSYDPIELSLVFWGGKNNYWGKFDSKVRQNILMCCYYDKQTEEQIATQLGVPTAYLEDELKALVEYDLLTAKNGYYLTNVPIITNEVFGDIAKANKTAVSDISERIRCAIDKMSDEVRALGFYGNDMPQNQLRWMLTSLILHLSYIDISMSDQPLDFPTDVFGDKCFRFFVEKSASDPYSVGTSGFEIDNGMILFWDVLINGERLHQRMTEARADMLCSLLNRQPQTDNEKLVCSELVELGLAVRTENGIMPNFPCLTKEQGDKLNEMIIGIGKDISEDILSRTNSVGKILRDHAPAHLADYVRKMPLLIFYRETEQVIQQLCESGWLLPMKGGMSGTTVMCLK